MPWNFRNDRSIYLQITEALTEAIVTGAYPPGGQLPSVRELAPDAGVNPNTAQRALAELESRGLAYSRRTGGRFVTEQEDVIAHAKQEIAAARVAAFLADMARIGCGKDDITALLQSAKEERK